MWMIVRCFKAMAADALCFAALSIILCNTDLHTHTHTHTHTLTLTTTLIYGQQPQRQTWVCFRFVDILIELESGFLWKTRITHDRWAFSLWRLVSSYRIEFNVVLADSSRPTCSGGETQRENALMSVHIYRTLCCWKVKQFSLHLTPSFFFCSRGVISTFPLLAPGLPSKNPRGGCRGGAHWKLCLHVGMWWVCVILHP